MLTLRGPRAPVRPVVGLGRAAVVVLLVLLVLAAVAGPARPRRLAGHAPLPAFCRDGGCAGHLRTGAGAWRIPVYRNYPLTGTDRVTRATVVVHGTGRNAKGYFGGMLAAAGAAGLADRTLIVAPRFSTDRDGPGAEEARWTNPAWKQGGEAERPAGLSSFAVLDRLLAVLADKRRFPRLTHITVAGHSAGGQFVQRYAALGRGPDSLRGVTVSYVAANPSSFLYFGPERPTGTGAFGIPAGCPDYNRYKYGLDGRTGYVGAVTPAQALATYARRRVVILSGGADTRDNHHLDLDCAARRQGPDRASRAATYAAYMHRLAPRAPHGYVVVPGVGHQGDAMFGSPLARAALFGG